MADNCFDNQPHENVDNCPNEEISGGLATTLFYIPTAFVETFTLPVADTFEGRLTIASAGIVPKTGKGWKSIDVLVDESELKAPLIGNKGNKKTTSELGIYIPGFKKKSLGFIDAFKNTPTIYAVPDANGQLWIVGTKLLPAFIDASDPTSGKKMEDNSGVPATIKSNAKLYAYDGEITVTADVVTP